jgi:3D (Asp-Asp-Asp) domain-containing protein
MKKLLTYASLTILLSLKSACGYMVKTTSYCPQEPGGFRAATGIRLHLGHCAADPRYYPYGTILAIGGRRYVVVDTGSAIRGKRHIDIFCRNMREMIERGTQFLDLKVVGFTSDFATL